MKRKGSAVLVVCFAVIGLLLMGAQGYAEQKPTTLKSCGIQGCHAPAEKVLRGVMVGLAPQPRLININTGVTWLVRYGDETKLIGAEKWGRIGKDKDVAVTYIEKDGGLFATSLSVKQPVKVAPDKQISVEELTKLVEKGPGTFVVVDTRHAQKYAEGHIPGSINIYEGDFDKLKDRLPKEKDKLLIFYCSGPTCRLSTAAARKAEQAGYAKVKVFVDGMPAWKKAGNLVFTSPQYINEAIDKGIPTVIVDLRYMDEAKKGHIVGAVSVPEKEISQAKEKFPSEKSAPIILYSGDAKMSSDEFRVVRGWGYSNVSVLEGGIEAWKKANGLIIKGDVPLKISYEPKPVPGEFPLEEFKKVIETHPADKLIVDVREADEMEDGVIPGSKNVPLSELRARMSELPKDKELITHCVSGVRADMAYIILKEAGYKVRFLNSRINFEDGKYSFVPKE